MKRIILCLIAFVPLMIHAQNDLSQASIEVSEEAPGLYRLFVAGRVSVVAFDGPDGWLIIDSGYEQTANILMDTIKGIADKPIRFLVNTHIHADHTGGNKIIGRDAEIIAHPSVRDFLSKEQTRNNQVIPGFPEYALPDITFSDTMSLDFNDQTLQMKHLPKGHTGGDIIIYFPENKVLAVGDLLFAGYFPYVDVPNGGDPVGYLENVEWILNNFPSDVKIIGGHGPVFSMQQLASWHDNLKQTLEVVRQAKANGMSLEQMKSQGILQKWEDYGNFFITEDRWLDTIYPAV